MTATWTKQSMSSRKQSIALILSKKKTVLKRLFMKYETVKLLSNVYFSLILMDDCLLIMLSDISMKQYSKPLLLTTSIWHILTQLLPLKMRKTELLLEPYLVMITKKINQKFSYCSTNDTRSITESHI